MKKSTCFVFFFCCIFLLRSQFNSEFLKYADYSNHVSLYADYEINSNSVNNKFAEKFYRGGYIDSALKKNVSDNMMARNYIGGHASFGANVFFGKDSSNVTWLVGIKNQEIANAAYTRDLFNIAFYGNSMYKGQRAMLDNINLNYYKFQELKLGFVWKNVDTVGKIGGALSFLKGQSLFQYKTLDTNYLYTAADATYLDYYANFSLTQSDTARNGMDAMNGYGLSGDLYVETPYKSRIGPCKFILTVNNLGFIRWNKQTIHYTVDSLFQFSGYQVNSFSDLQDSTLSSISKDSVFGNITRVVKENENTNLPMNFIVIHQADLSKNFSLRVGLRHIFNGNYKPYIFIDSKFRFSKSFTAGILLAYGGYGKFSSGCYIDANIKQQWHIRLGSNSLQGFVNTRHTRGQSAYLTLSRCFK